MINFRIKLSTFQNQNIYLKGKIMRFSEIKKHILFVRVKAGDSFSPLLYKDSDGAAKRVRFDEDTKKLCLSEVENLKKEAEVQLLCIPGVISVSSGT